MFAPVLNPAGMGLGQVTASGEVGTVVATTGGAALVEPTQPRDATMISSDPCAGGNFLEWAGCKLGIYNPYEGVAEVVQPGSAVGTAPASALTPPYVPSATDILAAQVAAAQGNVAVQNAAIDAAAKAAADAAQCGFICNLQKYGTGAVIGVLAAGGVMLFLMLKK